MESGWNICTFTCSGDLGASASWGHFIILGRFAIIIIQFDSRFDSPGKEWKVSVALDVQRVPMPSS